VAEKCTGELAPTLAGFEVVALAGDETKTPANDGSEIVRKRHNAA